MELRGPWGPRAARGCEAALLGLSAPAGPVPRQMHFHRGQQQTFSGSGGGEQLSTLFIPIPFWQYSDCFLLFPAGSETIHGAVGCTCLHMAFQSGVFEERIHPLPRALCRARSSRPLPPPPTPANGHVSANTQGGKHSILNVSLSWWLSHFFHCASWLIQDFEIPSSCSQVGFQSVLHLGPHPHTHPPKKKKTRGHRPGTWSLSLKAFFSKSCTVLPLVSPCRLEP